LEAGKKARTRSAVALVFAARQAERILGILSIAVLARLLAPADFGIVALAGSVVAVAEVLSRFGFDWGVIRLEKPDREHYDTAWTLRVIAGVAVFAVILAAAYPMAELMQRPVLVWVIAALGLNTLVGAFENIWMAEYRRNTEFGPEFKVRVSAKVVGLVSSVALALLTRSYWSLVVGVLASTCTTVGLSYVMHKAVPRWTLTKRAELLGFSAWMLITQAIEVARIRLAELWLGRHFGTTSVGHYVMAHELASLATDEIAAPVNRVVFANYAQIGNDIDRLRATYFQVAGMVWLVAVPAAVGVWLCARHIIAILLGPQWLQAVEMLQVLAVFGLLTVLESSTRSVYFGLGRARFVACLSAVGMLAFIAAIATLGSSAGAVGVAWAQVAAAAAVVIVNLTALFWTLRIRIPQFVAHNFRIIAASAAMALFVTYVDRLISFNRPDLLLVELAIMVGAGVLSYGATLFALWFVSGRPGGSETLLISLVSQRWSERKTPASAP
jgi:O-antigen/teichoic acid export membrane protein